jgi:hypothetical protein
VPLLKERELATAPVNCTLRGNTMQTGQGRSPHVRRLAVFTVLNTQTRFI